MRRTLMKSSPRRPIYDWTAASAVRPEDLVKSSDRTVQRLLGLIVQASGAVGNALILSENLLSPPPAPPGAEVHSDSRHASSRRVA